MNYFKYLMADGHSEHDVSRFTQEMVLANNEDRVAAKLGHLKPDDVRSAEVTGWIDTGAHDLILPEVVGDSLGFPPAGTVKVGFANNQKAQRRRVGEVHLTLCGRSATFTAVLLPERHDALIGALVLETLYLLVEPVSCRLRPRDPEMQTSMIDTAETIIID